MIERPIRRKDETEEEHNSRDAHERAQAWDRLKKAEHARLIAEGKVIDTKAAMARCFTAGNHGTEALRGGFD